jgi:hypothetical protein
MQQELKPEMIATYVEPAAVYQGMVGSKFDAVLLTSSCALAGHPFVVEAAVSLGGKTVPAGINIHRYDPNPPHRAPQPTTQSTPTHHAEHPNPPHRAPQPTTQSTPTHHTEHPNPPHRAPQPTTQSTPTHHTEHPNPLHRSL